jgi:hypothetical protein
MIAEPDLAGRIKNLEQHYRRAKRFHLILLACLVVVCFVAAASFDKRLTLVDADGREDFVLGSDVTNDSVRVFIMKDTSGRNRIAMGITNNNKVFFNVFDHDGKTVKTYGEVD